VSTTHRYGSAPAAGTPHAAVDVWGDQWHEDERGGLPEDRTYDDPDTYEDGYEGERREGAREARLAPASSRPVRGVGHGPHDEHDGPLPPRADTVRADKGVEEHGRSDLAPPKKARLRHRPALDGLRGLAVGSCLTYQMIPEQFTGGWLGIDMFLTLSGFFIAAMLLQERRATGTINYWRFIKRRGRRLLPGHLLLLACVLVLGFLLLPAGRQKALAGDVAASVFEVVNWRFIAAEQSYFNHISLPSPLRHMWSLSVQEQYYVIFPLILIGIARFVRTQRTLLLFFGGLTALSLWRMWSLYVPGTDPSRVYYGTDTRIFEVLIGVLGAILLSERAFAFSRGRKHTGLLARYDKALGWAGLASLALLFYWMITLSEYSPWLFQGGLAAVCFLTMIAIVACSSPYDNLLQRLLSVAWLRWIGRMGFSLYIWHWPLVVFTALALPDWSPGVRNTFSMALTVVIAWLSHTYLETPIHERGVKALFPSRPTVRKVVTLGVAPALLLGSFGLAQSSTAAARKGSGDNRIVEIPPYVSEGTDKFPVILLGNSVAAGLGTRGKPDETTPDLNLGIIASLGCNPVIRDARITPEPTPPSAECVEWREKWPSEIKRDEKPVVTYLLSMFFLADFKVGDRYVEPGTPEHDAVVRGMLDEIRQRSFDAGAGGFVLANNACHDRIDFGGDLVVERSNDIEEVKHLNAIALDWARSHRVEVLDTYGLLCEGDHYYNKLNDVPLYDDTVHYSESSAPMVLQWMAPNLREAVKRRDSDRDGLADLR
jgi:peptidoglycan/LPS O-acetylase OafA/YrhL